MNPERLGNVTGAFSLSVGTEPPSLCTMNQLGPEAADIILYRSIWNLRS